MAADPPFPSAAPTLATAAALVLVLAACGGGPGAEAEVPDGYHRYEEGALSVVLPEGLSSPEGAKVASSEFDVYLQDDPDPDAETLGLAALGMIDARSTIINGDDYGAASTLDWFVVADPFGKAHPRLPEREDLSRDGLTIFRQDVPRGPKDDLYYLWAAQDEESGRVVALALGGDRVTDEVLDLVDRTLAIVEPAQ